MPPSDAPPGNVRSGGPIAWFSITLSIIADGLDPDEVIRLLGVEPDVAQRKGVRAAARGGHGRVPRFGMWSIVLRREGTTEWDVEAALGMLIDRIPAPIGQWQAAPANSRARIFAGMSLDTHRRGRCD